MITPTICLLCNPTYENEKSLKITATISTHLKKLSVSHTIFSVTWPDAINDFSQIWIIGGDGTLNCFISQYPDNQIPVSIFPGGSGNDFHWMLYGEMIVAEQIEKLLNGSVYLVDGGICNGKLFINGVGIGFDGAIVHDLIGKKKLAGKASYLLSILKHIVRYTEKKCTLHFPDEVIQEDCFMISIANAKRYGGGFHVAPRASITDGMLDISIIGSISPLQRIRYLPVIEKGAHLQLPFVQYRQEKRIIIESPVKLHAHLDGEYIISDRFEIDCLPKRFPFIW